MNVVGWLLRVILLGLGALIVAGYVVLVVVTL